MGTCPDSLYQIDVFILQALPMAHIWPLSWKLPSDWSLLTLKCLEGYTLLPGNVLQPIPDTGVHKAISLFKVRQLCGITFPPEHSVPSRFPHLSPVSSPPYPASLSSFRFHLRAFLQLTTCTTVAIWGFASRGTDFRQIQTTKVKALQYLLAWYGMESLYFAYQWLSGGQSQHRITLGVEWRKSGWYCY